MTQFSLFLGIDYSGAETASTPLTGLQVYGVRPGEPPHHRLNPALSPKGRHRHWTRESIATMLRQQARNGARVLAGIDHGFSFPQAYFERYGLTSWQTFLEDFVRHWPTDRAGVRVDDVRSGGLHAQGGPPADARIGATHELRLCERWTSSAKSVFQFDMQGSVAKSTHAGIPWLKHLRDEVSDCLHFWPFDGWTPPPDKSVVVEIYPSMFRKRYAREGRTVDEHDAYAAARGMADMAARGALSSYFNPSLSAHARAIAELEGWILGVW